MTCPRCGEECERDMVDVGCGEMPASPWGCPNCYWVEEPVALDDEPGPAGPSPEEFIEKFAPRRRA